MLEYYGEKIEERDDRKFAQLDAEMRLLHETYNDLPAPLQAATSTIVCAPAGALAGGAVAVGTKNPAAGWTAGVVVDASCAATIAAWAEADYQTLVFVDSQDDNSGDDGQDSESDSGDSNQGDGSEGGGNSQSDSDGGTGDGHPDGTDQGSRDEDKVTPDDVADALNRGENVDDLLNQMYCQQGDASYC